MNYYPSLSMLNPPHINISLISSYKCTLSYISPWCFFWQLLVCQLPDFNLFIIWFPVLFTLRFLIAGFCHGSSRNLVCVASPPCLSVCVWLLLPLAPDCLHTCVSSSSSAAVEELWTVWSSILSGLLWIVSSGNDYLAAQCEFSYFSSDWLCSQWFFWVLIIVSCVSWSH